MFNTTNGELKARGCGRSDFGAVRATFAAPFSTAWTTLSAARSVDETILSAAEPAMVVTAVEESLTMAATVNTESPQNRDDVTFRCFAFFQYVTF